MSATLGGGLAERVASLMQPPSSGHPVPVVRSEGRSYPVGELRDLFEGRWSFGAGGKLTLYRNL